MAETRTCAALESKLVMLWLTVPLRKEVQRRLFHRCRLELRLLQHHWYRKLQNQMLSMHPLGKFHLKHRILFEGINCQGVKQPPKSVLPWGKLGLIEHLFLLVTALGSSLTLQNKTARPCWKEASFETRGLNRPPPSRIWYNCSSKRCPAATIFFEFFDKQWENHRLQYGLATHRCLL